jgi:hypothetical protein
VSLVVYGENRVLGRITRLGGALQGSNQGVQQMADSALRRAGGDAEAAYARLRNYGNGYLQVAEEDVPPATAGRFTWSGDDLEFT